MTVKVSLWDRSVFRCELSREYLASRGRWQTGLAETPILKGKSGFTRQAGRGGDRR